MQFEFQKNRIQNSLDRVKARAQSWAEHTMILLTRLHPGSMHCCGELDSTQVVVLICIFVVTRDRVTA